MQQYLVTVYLKVEAESQAAAHNKVFNELGFVENNIEVNLIGVDTEPIDNAALKLA